MIDILEQRLPTEIANKILLYLSHPTADIMRKLIRSHTPYTSICKPHQYIHYLQVKSEIRDVAVMQKWTLVLFGCGCRICTDIREFRWSLPN